MRYLFPLTLALAICAVALGQANSTSPATQTSPSIPYSTLQVINEGDSSEIIAEKAAKVLPRPNQTAWMRFERSFFIHFGPNAFNRREWGDGHESPSIFNPTSLDAEQWVRAVKDAGGQMVIPVCKHHDGFCLWPSRYTDHSVAASPWLGGKGDVIRAVSDAAHKYGVKLGVYLSPADLYQLRTNPNNPHGYYGNNSPSLPSVIPTDPASFKTDPLKGRTPPPGFQSYTYQLDDYNRYYLNQLYELFTDYGPIYEINLDGANPDPSVKEHYDYAAWYDLIHHLQPQCIISVKGPDSRWVGNEGGVARTTEWSVIPLPTSPDSFTWPDMTGWDLGSRHKLTPGSSLWWYPAETNVPILYGWFWAPHKYCRTAAQLIDNYYQSIGRNTNLLVNLSPDTRGLIPDNQLAHLRLMTQVINDTFAHDLAAGAELTADNSNTEHPSSLAMDGNLDTWWEAAPGRTTATLTLRLPAPATFDVLSLQEAVDHRGQRIESFSVDVWNDAKWTQVDQQTTVGRKRLLRWNSPVTTDQLRIRITGSRLEPTLAAVALFKQAQLVQPPAISERDADGAVSISDAGALPIVYTTDESMPTPQSPAYRSPIHLPRGGTLNAACIDRDGRVGMMASKYISGFAPIGWKVLAVDDQPPPPASTAPNAIDANPSTLWQSADSPTPHSLTIDMDHPLDIAGFSYLPRQDKKHDGIVETYRLETSLDGKSWTTVIDQGRFWNIRNNPVLQEATFPPVRARFFRFTALTELDGPSHATAAEITVLPPDSPVAPQ